MYLAGVNFTNIPCVAFTHADPKSAKKTNGLTVFSALLASWHVTALRKMLVKSILSGRRRLSWHIHSSQSHISRMECVKTDPTFLTTIEERGGTSFRVKISNY